MYFQLTLKDVNVISLNKIPTKESNKNANNFLTFQTKSDQRHKK